MDEMKCEWSGVKNVARTGIPFIKLDRISVLYAVGLFATFENISFTELLGPFGQPGQWCTAVWLFFIFSWAKQIQN